MTPRFTRFAAIDWSGARGELQHGIAVAVCERGEDAPRLIDPPARAWSRAAVLGWLLEQAQAVAPMLIGLDLSPAFPFADRGAYFPSWPQSPPDAPALWALVEMLSADDPHHAVTGFVDDAETRRHFRHHGDTGDLFGSGRGRLRVCEERQLVAGLSPTSCFNLVGAAQVGKASLTGMRVLHAIGGRIPIWPFDLAPETGPVIVEIYTTIAARAAGIRKGLSKMRDAAALDGALAALGSRPHAPLARYTDHATDAMLAAAWLRTSAERHDLWRPIELTEELARTEGWTFGVV